MIVVIFKFYGTAPTLFLRDTNDNPDYRIMNSHGSFKIFDETNGVDRFIINPNGKVSILYDLDVDGHTELDDVNVSGALTATTIVGTSLTITGISTLGSVQVSSGIITTTPGATGVVTYYGDGQHLTGVATALNGNAVATTLNGFSVFYISIPEVLVLLLQRQEQH